MKQKVMLRAIEPEDLDLLYQIENNQDLWNIGITNVPYSRYMLANYIASASNDIYKDQQLRLIIENQEGTTVGIIDLQNFDIRHSRAEVGIIIIDEYRKKGYAYEAMQLMIKYCNDILHINQLYAIIDEENNASIKLFRKSGFNHLVPLKQWFFDGETYKDGILAQLFFKKS